MLAILVICIILYYLICYLKHRRKIWSEKGLTDIESYMMDDHEMLRRAATECICNLLQFDDVSVIRVIYHGKIIQNIIFGIPPSRSHFISSVVQTDFITWNETKYV